MLRAVCFDLWGTLIADPPGRGEARARERVARIDRALRAGDWSAPREAIEAAMQTTVDALVAVHLDNHDLDAAERVTLFYRQLDPSLRPEIDLPPGVRGAITAAIHDSALDTPPELIPGALETVAALRKRGLRLALISNTGLSPGTALRRLLDQLGLSAYFTAEIYSDELGAWKPDARMFEEAVFALGVAARDTLYVGDTPEADIVGAQAFGIGMTAQVGTKRVEGVRASLELSDVGALLAALETRGLIPEEEA